tara:strand:- start:16168 stop:16836 length:669 start_codon:yes stop_codon:yes gene_type:complete
MEFINKKDFYESGLWIVDNFLPLDLANQLSELMLASNDYTRIEQVRDRHYKTFLKTEFANFPTIKENYQASFEKNEGIVDQHLSIFRSFHLLVRPFLKDLTENEVKFYTKPLCYKMLTGDHLRLHKDLYAGGVGYTFYASKNWCWDWGGTFNFYLPEKDEMRQVLPKFNRIIFRNEKIKLFHFVPPVTPYAQLERLSINGWASVEDKSEELKNKTIGEYYRE